MTYTIADLGWLAGILDGEGTVALTCAPNRNPHLRLMLYNSDDAILEKLRRVLTDCGIPFYERRDTRAPRHSSMIQVGAAGAVALYPLIRPHLVRQVARYDAAVAFLQPLYQGRTRVYWTTAQRAEWQGLRDRFNAA